MCSSAHQNGVVGRLRARGSHRLVGWWDEVEVVAILGDDELETPTLDVRAGGEADVASGRRGHTRRMKVR
jgi:hypothetical protein